MITHTHCLAVQREGLVTALSAAAAHILHGPLISLPRTGGSVKVDVLTTSSVVPAI